MIFDRISQHLLHSAPPIRCWCYENKEFCTCKIWNCYTTKENTILHKFFRIMILWMTIWLGKQRTLSTGILFSVKIARFSTDPQLNSKLPKFDWTRIAMPLKSHTFSRRAHSLLWAFWILVLTTSKSEFGIDKARSPWCDVCQCNSGSPICHATKVNYVFDARLHINLREYNFNSRNGN